MSEIWEQALLPYNLPLTILLGLVVVFLALTLLGAIGMDFLDFGIETDVDAEGVELGGVPAVMLSLVNAGAVPVIVVLSILLLVMWMASLTLNFYFNPGHGFLLAIGFFLASFVIGVVATKILTQPLVPLMRKLKDSEDAPPVIGETGVVRSLEIDSRFGQIEVQRADGAPALLNARLGVDAPPLARGASVIVVSIDEGTGIYLVRHLPESAHS